MADVFISYKREERAAVARIADSLARWGLSVWFDASLTAGESFSEEIDAEVRAAKAVLVCWSPEARSSRWVRAEALIGFERDALAAAYVYGPDKFSAPAPFNGVHAEDLRAWLASDGARSVEWLSLLRRIGKLCERRDLEAWGTLGVAVSAMQVRSWIAAYPDSVAFTAAQQVLVELEADEAAEAERIRITRERRREEQEARRVAASGARMRTLFWIAGGLGIVATVAIGIFALPLLQNTQTPAGQAIAAAGETLPAEPVVYFTDPWKQLMPWSGKNPAVKTTLSGLQYAIVQSGGSTESPPASIDRVTVNYEGRLENGEVFDSSYERGEPATFVLDQVVPGWTEGLQLMRPGDEFIFWIPPNLAYGDRGQSIIPPNSTLMFRVQLISVTRPIVSNKAAWASVTPWPASDHEKVTTTASGLQYVVVESSTKPGRSPTDRDMAVVYWEGRLDDGAVIASTFGEDPVTFPVGDLVDGWAEAMRMMRPGDRWMIRMPASLAYGKEGDGAIPPDASVTYEVVLHDVVRVPPAPAKVGADGAPVVMPPQQ